MELYLSERHFVHVKNSVHVDGVLFDLTVFEVCLINSQLESFMSNTFATRGICVAQRS